MPKNNGIKVGKFPVPFLSKLKHHELNFHLRQLIFEKSWEYAKDVFACHVDLKKAYDQVPQNKLWRLLQEYGIDGYLLIAIKSFHCQPEICVRVDGKQSRHFMYLPFS